MKKCICGKPGQEEIGGIPWCADCAADIRRIAANVRETMFPALVRAGVAAARFQDQTILNALEADKKGRA